ncbi:ImmA/IrrE family metallo-endopeptidase [Listeria fleischmannii]|uniref:IrrE N-terminal-like domain-containing protein n=1 Tax=Listeria fleischmannii FSL S10-1203 TaxID=1265822 RepID=W7E017_9LIST|nr:ImmA/IrrE family metallo-endopeptidase [Listeria fleischmannii]EUJ59492.1 hypothetical protein MCOL2_05820 [Listeria fleischmannii FSL S10-1203]
MFDEMITKQEELIKKFKTRDPFKLCEHLKIHIFFENLGNTYGYFNTFKQAKMIHINRNILEHEQKFTCAHELKHALFDSNINTPFLSENTLISVDKIEMQANYFATRLLIEDVKKFDTHQKLLQYYGIPLEMERFIKHLRY